jgi:frataxin
MDASQFESRADATLARLEQALEAAAGDELDAELVGGILTLELEDGGIYQINKHSPNREIWLSSPVSGAWHFAWHATEGSESEGVWRSTRGAERLEDLLGRELSESLGEVIALG